MGYILALGMGYLLGCSSMAYYLGKWKKTDPRTAGSGNLGASNAAVLFGMSAGVAVALHDIGKAVIAVLLAKLLFPALPYGGIVAGAAAVLGHIFPFYLKFRGGKGLASYFGMALALNWKAALVLALIIFLATVISDFISIGTFSAIILIPLYLCFVAGDQVAAAIACVVSVVMFFKHRENIVRLIRREEIGLRSTLRGENRVEKKK